MAARVAGVGAAVIVLTVLTGCASPSDEVRQYAKQAGAAEQSAVLGSTLFRQGKAPSPELSTLYQDSMKELTSAEQSLAQLPASGVAARRQHTALGSVRAAEDALLATQRELDEGSVSASGVDGLRRAAAALKKESRP